MTADPVRVPAVDWKLGELAARHASAADRTRELAPEVVHALREDGPARHFVASRWGGAEGSFTDLTQAVLEVARGCPASGWLASLSAYAARFAAHLPTEGQRAIWGESADVLVAAGLIPSGRARAVEGGWRLDGTWNYVSGGGHADWVLLCAAVPTAGGPPELRFFAVPRGEYLVRDTWDAIGMRATGSHTVVVDDVLVPQGFSFARAELFTGRCVPSDVPVHQVPFAAVAGLTFVGPAVGAALGMLDACGAALKGRKRTPAKEIQLVRASGLIDSARLLVEENALLADTGEFTPETLARAERNAAAAAELVGEAVTSLIRTAGTSGLSEAHPAQRFWRDATVAVSHVALQYETSAGRSHAAVLLGPEPASETRGGGPR
ncbi:acyl-CoA dehydrogenase family protein [Streptomyces sp. NPDC056049]|uniref:acyl-CoA dehydrogenase family protein n=1 Tax=Streptomyces sp. NPDC056049 TaxID=3345693 RepID=UPI0035DCA148